MTLLLINVLLAILIDAYSAVKQVVESTNYFWVDVVAEIRIALLWFTHHSVYADLRVAEKEMQKLTATSPNLPLNVVYARLTAVGVPSFIVWNTVLVLERKAKEVASDTDELKEQIKLHYELGLVMSKKLAEGRDGRTKGNSFWLSAV